MLTRFRDPRDLVQKTLDLVNVCECYINPGSMLQLQHFVTVCSWEFLKGEDFLCSKRDVTVKSAYK